MKRTYYITTLILALALGFTACKKKEYVLDDAPSKLEGINGTFTLSKVMQVDQKTLSVDNTMDVSSVFIGATPAKVTFSSSDLTFSYDPGSSIDFIGASGTWAFDNNEYPTKVTMNSTTGTYDLNLIRTIRPSDATLEVELDRVCRGEVTSSYQYIFARN